MPKGHDGALTLLASFRPKGRREAAAAAMLKASVHFALYRVAGQQDRWMLEEVKARVGECRRSDPSVRPSREIFPPGFVALFEGIE